MQKKPGRLLANTASLAASEIVARIFSAALMIYVARRFGVSQFGQLAFAVAATSYVSLFADFGLTSLGVRDMAKTPGDAPHIAINVLVLQLLASGLGVGALWLILGPLPVSPNTKSLTILLGLSAFPAAMNLSYVFQAYERMEYAIVARVMGQVVYLALGVLLLMIYKTVLVVAVVTVAGAMVTALAALAILRSRFGFQIGRPSGSTIRRLLASGLPFLTTAVMVQIYTNADSFIVQFSRGTHALGVYSAPYRLVLLIPLAGGFAGRAFYPRLARTFAAERTTFDQLVKTLAAAVASVGMPVAVVGILFSGEIVRVIYGPAYADAAEILAILMVLPPLMLANSTIGYSLDASGHQKRSAVGTSLAAGANVALNLLVIPKFGLRGAAWVTVATELFLLIWLAIYQQRDLQLTILPAFLGPPLIGCGGMATAILLVPTTVWVPVRLLLGAAAYLGLVAASGGYGSAQWNTVRHAWHR